MHTLQIIATVVQSNARLPDLVRIYGGRAIEKSTKALDRLDRVQKNASRKTTWDGQIAVLTSPRSRAILGLLDILVDIGVPAEKEVIQ